MNVYIGGAKDYSAMRGPCAEGFHVPLLSELNSLCSIFLDFGWITEGGNEYTVNSFNNIQQYLFAPADGYLWHGTGEYVSNTVIWWHSCNSDPNNGCYSLNINSTGLVLNNYTKYNDTKQIGKSIRPFKNTSVVPDSNWTVLYQGTGTAGIYHNSTLGLISLSSDGINWITIADKNLGATTVYNYGDTLSESNCGKFYQRGNNYGFTRGINAGTTSSTAVDASSYGPGNYYSSSTFITAYPRDSSNNDNLRGGVTGIVSPAPLKNAYIGEYGWKPGSNTIAYYPLTSTSTVNDISGNNKNLTNSGVTFGNYQGVDCAYFNGSSYMYKNESLITGSQDFSVNLWYNRGGIFREHSNIISIGTANGTNSFIIRGENDTNKLMIGGWSNDRNTGYVPPLNTWINICVTHSNGALNVYVNGSLIYTGTVSYTLTSTSTNIGSGVQGSSGLKMIGLQSELIFENKVRTTQEISDYYNQTKSNYGL